MRTIVAAAIRIEGLVLMMPKPNRHHNIIHKTVDVFERGEDRDLTYISHDQGFITSDGEYVDRETAKQIVKESGQTTIPRDYGDSLRELFSEDLW